MRNDLIRCKARILIKQSLRPSWNIEFLGKPVGWVSRLLHLLWPYLNASFFAVHRFRGHNVLQLISLIIFSLGRSGKLVAGRGDGNEAADMRNP